MGGMGFISGNHATILRNNTLIDLNTIEAAHVNGVRRYLYSSSACVYPEHLQAQAGDVPLQEDDAYPANPQDAYGWEKLIAERMCLYFAGEFGMQTRIARFHNVYGPFGTYDGGREKVPAALCRKVAAAPEGGASRSGGTASRPGRSATSTIASRGSTDSCAPSTANHSISARKRSCRSTNSPGSSSTSRASRGLSVRHVPGPQGVRGRNSDNRRLRRVLGWEPSIALHAGLVPTYRWIVDQVREAGTAADAVGVDPERTANSRAVPA